MLVSNARLTRRPLARRCRGAGWNYDRGNHRKLGLREDSGKALSDSRLRDFLKCLKIEPVLRRLVKSTTEQHSIGHLLRK